MIINELERLLSLEDRDVGSPTYGCFDRSYWGWKFKDMPDSVMQNGVYALSLAWKNKFANNEFYRNENVLEWIRAGIGYWIKIQKKDGSFDQIYPYERSWAATGFELFYMLETYRLIGKKVIEPFAESFFEAVDRATEFLIESDELHGDVSNHVCAGVAGLYGVYKERGDRKALVKCKQLLAKLNWDREEGWLMEYEGTDPGYQSLAIYYLAKYFEDSRDKKIEKDLERLMDFVEYFFQPDGSFGGEYGSRNTEVFYPGGFYLMGRKVAFSNQLKLVDDNNLIPLLINYLEAELTNGGRRSKAVWEKREFNKLFEKAGLYIINKKAYYSVVSVKKNGLIKVFDKRKKILIYDDHGYLGASGKGEMSTQFINQKARFELEGNRIEIEGEFAKVGLMVQTPGLIWLLRGFNVSLGRLAFLNELMKKLLVKVLVNNKARAGLMIVRTIKFGEKNVMVKDMIKKTNEGQVLWLRRDRHRTIHMGSSRYFEKHQLHEAKGESVDVGQLNNDGQLKLSWKAGL